MEKDWKIKKNRKMSQLIGLQHKRKKEREEKEKQAKYTQLNKQAADINKNLQAARSQKVKESASITRIATTRLSVSSPKINRKVPVEEDRLFWWAQYTAAKIGYNVTNWTTSWRDGLAFCGLIHANRDDLFDIREMKIENKEINIKTAIEHAQKLGMLPTITVDDILKPPEPPKEKVRAFVLECYYFFEQPEDPNQKSETPPETIARTNTPQFMNFSNGICESCGKEKPRTKLIVIGAKYYCDGACGKKAFIEHQREKRKG